ncbi:MAG: tetratricopeptide repeat protein [Spirochaetia bacterium]
MKALPVFRTLFLLVPPLLALSVFPGSAQDFHTARTEEYEVKSSVGQDHARETAETLQGLSQLYNEYFRFDTEELAGRLQVRVFSDKEDFDEYLSAIIDETRDEFVYLHYSDAARSELVGYVMEDSERYRASMTHQSVIQFMRAFVSNPPLWLREGFAVYFEQARYDPDEGEAVFQENSAWIDPLQELLSGESSEQPFTLEEFLHLDAESASSRLDAFYPQAWGAISFLLNADDPAYVRLLWDALAELDAQDSLSRNSERVENRVLRWVETDELIDDFVDYAMGLRSFTSLVQEGIEEYSASRYDEAEALLQRALEYHEEHHVPWYYLGLTSYANGDYESATDYYERAGELGADEALISYALGLNAFASDRPQEAQDYLSEAADMDPERYGDDAEALIERIRADE